MYLIYKLTKFQMLKSIFVEDILDKNCMMKNLFFFFTFRHNTYTCISLIIIIINIIGKAYSLTIQIYLLYTNGMLHK